MRAATDRVDHPEDADETREVAHDALHYLREVIEGPRSMRAGGYSSVLLSTEFLRMVEEFLEGGEEE